MSSSTWLQKQNLIEAAQELLDGMFAAVETENQRAVDGRDNLEDEDGLPAALCKAMSDSPQVRPTDVVNSATAAQEFSLYETAGKITPNLQLLQKAPRTIKPTSIGLSCGRSLCHRAAFPSPALHAVRSLKSLVRLFKVNKNGLMHISNWNSNFSPFPEMVQNIFPAKTLAQID